MNPSGGGQVLFTDWKEKVEAYMRESPDEGDAVSRLRGSLRGLAAERVNPCVRAVDIVKKLDEIYGTVLSVEDMYEDFVRLSIQKGETLSDFLSRLWNCFLRLNEAQQFTELDMSRKVYHSFITKATSVNAFLTLNCAMRLGLQGPRIHHLNRCLGVGSSRVPLLLVMTGRKRRCR